MLAAMVAFVGMNACVKLLREDGFSTAETLFFRTTPGLPILWLALRRRRVGLRPHRADLVLLRSVLGLAAMATSFYALAALSIVQSQVLYLSQPVFVALLAPRVLGEPHRRLVLWALGLGALGALLVIVPAGPFAAPPHVPALAGLASAVFSALAHLTVRRSSATEPAELIVFYFALHVSIASLAWGLASGDFQQVRPYEADLVPLLETAILGTIGQICMTRAYAQASASRVAVVAYAAIPLGLGADIVLWAVHPGPSALIGAVLMLVAGYLLGRR